MGPDFGQGTRIKPALANTSTPCQPLPWRCTTNPPPRPPPPLLLQDQYWCYVANAYEDMAPEEFQELLHALGPPLWSCSTRTLP